MKDKLAKLIDVKSIMTLVLTVVFCFLALKGVISGQEFLTIFTVIVGFYFGTQAQKGAGTTTVTTQTDTSPTGIVAPQEDTVPATVDESTVNEIHPPDAENDITVTGFAG